MGAAVLLLALGLALAAASEGESPAAMSAAEMYGPMVRRPTPPVAVPQPRVVHALPRVVNEPGKCPETCHGHGQCLLQLGEVTLSASGNTQVHTYQCVCDAGWVGDTCATPVDALLKHYLTKGQSPHPPCCSVCRSQREPLDRFARIPIATDLHPRRGPQPGASVAFVALSEAVTEAGTKPSAEHVQPVRRLAGAAARLVGADGQPVPAPVDVHALYPSAVDPMAHPVTPCCVVCDFGAEKFPRKSEVKGRWAQRIERLRLGVTHRQYARAAFQDESGCCLMCPRYADQSADDTDREASRFHSLPGAHRPLRRSMRRGCCDACPSQYWLRDTSVDADAFTPSKFAPKPDAVPVAAVTFPSP